MEWEKLAQPHTPDPKVEFDFDQPIVRVKYYSEKYKCYKWANLLNTETVSQHNISNITFEMYKKPKSDRIRVNFGFPHMERFIYQTSLYIHIPTSERSIKESLRCTKQKHELVKGVLEQPDMEGYICSIPKAAASNRHPISLHFCRHTYFFFNPKTLNYKFIVGELEVDGKLEIVRDRVPSNSGKDDVFAKDFIDIYEYFDGEENHG